MFLDSRGIPHDPWFAYRVVRSELIARAECLQEQDDPGAPRLEQVVREHVVDSMRCGETCRGCGERWPCSAVRSVLVPGSGTHRAGPRVVDLFIRT